MKVQASNRKLKIIKKPAYLRLEKENIFQLTDTMLPVGINLIGESFSEIDGSSHQIVEEQRNQERDW